MKHLSWIACCTLLTGLGAGTLEAQPISVQVTGHVVSAQDSTGLLPPYLLMSQPVTAIYTYDPIASVSQLPQPGMYSLSTSSASIVVTIGSFTFQTGPASNLTAQVQPGVPGSYWGEAQFSASQNPPLPNGVNVDIIAIGFTDSTGQWPTSAAVPDSAPNLASYAYSQMMIMGPYTSTGFFQIQVAIDSAQLLPPAIEVSPQAGSFIPQQHFDAVVLLPLSGAPVATMQASVGGQPLALNYPGTCQLATPTSAGRAALLCPGADAAVASLQGITQVDWQVTLTDGTSFTQSVQWKLLH